jgi:hypothetical protein
MSFCYLYCRYNRRFAICCGLLRLRIYYSMKAEVGSESYEFTGPSRRARAGKLKIPS